METNHPPLATVMDLLLDAVCVVDPQGRYLYVNAGYERIFGYSAAEVLGKPMIDLVHPDDRERTLQAAREVMDGQPKLHFRNRYIRKDGRVVDVQWSARWSEDQRRAHCGGPRRHRTQARRGGAGRAAGDFRGRADRRRPAGHDRQHPCHRRRAVAGHQLLRGIA